MLLESRAPYNQTRLQETAPGIENGLLWAGLCVTSLFWAGIFECALTENIIFILMNRISLPVIWDDQVFTRKGNCNCIHFELTTLIHRDQRQITRNNPVSTNLFVKLLSVISSKSNVTSPGLCSEVWARRSRSLSFSDSVFDLSITPLILTRRSFNFDLTDFSETWAYDSWPCYHFRTRRFSCAISNYFSHATELQSLFTCYRHKSRRSEIPSSPRLSRGRRRSTLTGPSVRYSGAILETRASKCAPRS